MSEVVLAAYAWPSNAELIADVASLYLDPEVPTLDPTYGRGIWWKTWRPVTMVAHDIATLDGVDFRSLPHGDGEFRQIAFDPPYVCVGGRETTGMADLHDRFGLTNAPKTPDGVQQLIYDGLDEMYRVLARKGILLVKCQDYVTSGKLWPGTHLTLNYALTIGLSLVDRFEHIAGVRPQPSGRRQVHARRNL